MDQIYGKRLTDPNGDKCIQIRIRGVAGDPAADRRLKHIRVGKERHAIIRAEAAVLLEINQLAILLRCTSRGELEGKFDYAYPIEARPQ